MNTSDRLQQDGTGAATDVRIEELVAHVARLSAQITELRQETDESTTSAETTPDRKPVYDTVEAWVTTYLLPTFPRPIDQVGMTRWHWCEQWWRHDEAVTRLTALWYGWEHARLEQTGMLAWLRELDHQLPILCGEDGPFRDCATANPLNPAHHCLPPIAPAQPAPEHWWNWWD